MGNFLTFFVGGILNFFWNFFGGEFKKKFFWGEFFLEFFLRVLFFWGDFLNFFGGDFFVIFLYFFWGDFFWIFFGRFWGKKNFFPANLTPAIHFTLASHNQISTNFNAFKTHWHALLHTLQNINTSHQH